MAASGLTREVNNILQEEDLPPDLLERGTQFFKANKEGLFDRLMQLEDSIGGINPKQMAQVLRDGARVADSHSSVDARKAATLPKGVRRGLAHLLDEGKPVSGAAAYLLTMDVQNRAHNRSVHDSETPA